MQSIPGIPQSEDELHQLMVTIQTLQRRQSLELFQRRHVLLLEGQCLQARAFLFAQRGHCRDYTEARPHSTGTSTHFFSLQLFIPSSASCTPLAPSRSVQRNGSSNAT